MNIDEKNIDENNTKALANVKKITAKVDNFIKENHMLEGCTHIVVGVSGGADSVCLLLMLKDYIKRHRLDTKLHAVHINHMIRDEAGEDEEFARKLCERENIIFSVKYIDCINIAKQNSQTVEEAGRTERYNIFAELAAQYTNACDNDGVVRIAVAHHMNDQAETVLMNMARGTSLKGIRGIMPVRDNIIRPLLCLTRSQIEEWLSSRNQPFVTDATNYDNDYTRNSVRNVIIPYMCEHINKRTVENISDMACEVREVQDYVERQINKLYDESVSCDKDNIRINVESLKVAEPVLVKGVIYKCLVKLSGRAKDIYSVNVEDVRKLINMQTGRRINSVYNITAIREYDNVLLCKNICTKKFFAQENASSEWSGVSVDISDISDNPKTIDINKDIYMSKEGIVTIDNITFSVIDKNILSAGWDNFADNGKICINKLNYGYAKYYDYDKINKLLDIRFRKTGDDIVVSKDGSSKKLKKELVDRKVPSAQRDKVLLICSQNNVLWACGIRRCEEYFADASTRRVLKILISLKERN